MSPKSKSNSPKNDSKDKIYGHGLSPGVPHDPHGHPCEFGWNPRHSTFLKNSKNGLENFRKSLGVQIGQMAHRWMP